MTIQCASWNETSLTRSLLNNETIYDRQINNIKIKITRIYYAIFSLIIPFASRGYKCKCMLRIIQYFQYYILYISFRTNIFSPIIFFAARITIRAMSSLRGSPAPALPGFLPPWVYLPSNFFNTCFKDCIFCILTVIKHGCNCWVDIR